MIKNIAEIVAGGVLVFFVVRMIGNRERAAVRQVQSVNPERRSTGILMDSVFNTMRGGLSGLPEGVTLDKTVLEKNQPYYLLDGKLVWNSVYTGGVDTALGSLGGYQ